MHFLLRSLDPFVAVANAVVVKCRVFAVAAAGVDASGVSVVASARLAGQSDGFSVKQSAAVEIARSI